MKYAVCSFEILIWWQNWISFRLTLAPGKLTNWSWIDIYWIAQEDWQKMFVSWKSSACHVVQCKLSWKWQASDRRYSLGLALIQKATLGDLQASIEISAHYHLWQGKTQAQPLYTGSSGYGKICCSCCCSFWIRQEFPFKLSLMYFKNQALVKGMTEDDKWNKTEL